MYVAAALGVLLLVAIGAGWYAAGRINPTARDTVVRALEQKMQSDVELESAEVSFMPGASAVLRKLKLRHHGRTDVPPFIEIDEAHVFTDYFALTAKPLRIDRVVLKGLRIHIPPKEPGQPRFMARSAGKGKPAPEFVISRVIADGTVLTILPRDPAREPLVWEMKKLALRSAGPKEAMHFDTILTNAKPPGEIVSQGRFGPWNAESLGDTPVNGEFTFDKADLSVFNGIAGILSSKGNYHGVLGRIETNGTTDTPDFRLGETGNKVPLKTEFHAIVDGTDGDTYLRAVKAMLGSTPIVCEGSVSGQPGVKGKTIELQTSIASGRIDDLLRLAVPMPKPPLAGQIRLRAKLVIPPGDVDVVRKLRLAGKFSMDQVRFTDKEIQDKLIGMSQRAQGKPKQEPETPITSHFDGNFAVARGTIRLDKLLFTIPGAEVQLAGKYGMRSEEIEFTGRLRMQARVSQTFTGVKRWLLKPVDPFFAKDGAGAVIPIKIGGTRTQPQFGLNMRARKKE